MAEAEDRLRKVLRSERGLTPFVGAGVSLAATGKESCASWKGLLFAGIKSCESAIPKLKDDGWGNLTRQKLEKADLDDYLAIGTEISNRLKGVGVGKDFDTWIENAVGTLRATKEGQLLIRTIRGLGSIILTTNYDSLLEDLEETWEACDWTDREFPAAVMRSKVVLHLHGSVAKPRSVVLGSGEYQRLESELNKVLTASFFISHTLAFIGCGDGLGDPHIAMVLRFMSRALRDEDVEHFILVTNEEHLKLSEHPLSDRIIPIPYGDHYDDLRPFLEKLVAVRENAVTTQPEAGEPDTPLQEGTGLLFVAVTAERKLRSALQGLDSVKEALQQVESGRAVSRDMADWDLGERIKEHRRLATRLKESAALLDTCAGRVTPLIEEAYNSTWQLTQPEFYGQAGELSQIQGAISALETVTRQLVARIARAREDLVTRINIYNGYQDPSDHLSRALEAVRKAHTRASSLRARLGPAETSQETYRERAAPPATSVRDTGHAGAAEPDPHARPPQQAEAPAAPVTVTELNAPFLQPAAAVAAGLGTDRELHDEEPVPVPTNLAGDKVIVVLVTGESMAGDDIHNGYYLVVDTQRNIAADEIAVFEKEGVGQRERFVKRVSAGELEAHYRSSSSGYPEGTMTAADDPRLIGKVIAVVRRIG